MKISDKQREIVARRMGYTGPMSKFSEYLVSSPNPVGMAEGGMVSTTKPPTTPETTTLDTSPYTPTTPTPTAQVPTIKVTDMVTSPDQFIDPKSGQLVGKTPVATTTEAQTTTATGATPVTNTSVDAFLTQPGINDVTDQFEYAQGTVSNESTVQGQLDNLMQDFEGGATPTWAAGALRDSTEAMNSRGLGSSSMAAAANTQAAMEAAIPIAAADAQTYANMEMQNLLNEQQMLIQKNDARTNAFFTDAATINATNQFNAANQIQVDQFNSSLKTQVEQFNATQKNAMEQFNAGQKNAVSQFNATMENNRQQFNASNRLIVDQANATWRQQIATIDNANINEANRQNAQNLFEANLAEMNNLFQERRDAINYAFNNAESDEDRALSLLLAQMSADEMEKASDQASSDAMWQAVGTITAEFFDGFSW